METNNEAWKSCRVYINFPIEFLENFMESPSLFEYGLFYAFSDYAQKYDCDPIETCESVYGVKTDDNWFSTTYERFLVFQQNDYKFSRVKCGIEVDRYRNIIDNYYSFSDRDKALNLFQLACKSILGEGIKKSTNFQMIFSRMSGRAKNSKEPLPEKIQQFNNRYQREKLRALCEKYYHIHFFSAGKGFYIINPKADHKQVIKEILNSPKSVARIKAREEKKLIESEMRERIRQQAELDFLLEQQKDDLEVNKQINNLKTIEEILDYNEANRGKLTNSQLNMLKSRFNVLSTTS